MPKLAEASRLSIRDRVIDSVWNTLPSDTLSPASEEWRVENQRCSVEVDAGRAETISGNK